MRKNDYIEMYGDIQKGLSFRLPECNTIKDYIKVLSVINAGDRSLCSFSDVYESVPESMKRRLAVYSPALCHRYDELNASQKDGIMSGGWCFTEKLDGVRAVFVSIGGDAHLYSRDYDSQCLPTDYSKNIYMSSKVETDYVIDMEVTTCDMGYIQSRAGVSTTLDDFLRNPNAKYIQSEYSSMHGRDLLSFNILVPLYYKESLMNLKIGDMISLNKTIMYELRGYGMNAMYARQCFGGRHQKNIFLDSILSNGGEGIVAYNMESFYDTDGKRGRGLFVKLKHKLSSDDIHDTIDCYVIGVEGNNFSVGYKVYDEGVEKEISFTIHIPHIYIDHSYDGILDYYYKGKVCEVKFSDIKGHSVAGVSFVKWRDDKMPFECSYEESFFKCRK